MKVKLNKKHTALLTTALSASVAVAFTGTVGNAGMAQLATGSDVMAVSSADTPARTNARAAINKPNISNGRWTCYYSDYEKDVKFYINLVNGDGTDLIEPSRYQIGVFVNNVCRGISDNVNNVGSHAVHNLRVWTNDNLEGLSMKLYDTHNGKVFDIDMPEFDVNASMVGSIDDPITINTGLKAPGPGLDISSCMGYLTERITQEVSTIPTNVEPYPSTEFDIDLSYVAVLLGVDESEVKFTALNEDQEFVLDHTTARNGGYWLDRNNHVCEWAVSGSDGYVFIEPVTEGDISKLRIGQMPHAFPNEDYTTRQLCQVYFYAHNRYIRLQVELNVIPTNFNKPYTGNDVWKCFYSNYENCKTAYIGLTNIMSHHVSDLSAYQLGAFVGNECRGIATSISGPDGYGQFAIRLWYNDSLEDVVFKLYNTHTGKVYDCEYDGLDFSGDKVGSIDNPELISSNAFGVNDMLINPSFHDGFNGWNYYQGNVGGFASNSYVEVFQNIVDCWQEIHGVPDGIYSLTCQAFERPAGNGQYDGTEASKSFLYINAFETPVQNISVDALPVDKAEHLVNSYLIDEDAPENDYILSSTPNAWADRCGIDWGCDWGYVPNSMPGASVAFNASRYYQKAYAIVEGGTLRIGLTSHGQWVEWVLWGNFDLQYEGKTQKAVENVADHYCKRGEKYIEENEMTNPGIHDLLNAINAVYDSTGDTELQYTKVIALNSALSDACLNHETLMNAYEAKTSMDETAAEFYASASKSAQTQYDAMKNVVLSDYTTAGLEELIGEFNTVSSKLRIPSFDAASDDDPANCTDVILNANIDKGARTGWEWWHNAQNGPELTNGINETPSAEFWNATASSFDALGNVNRTMEFDYYQTLAGLPNGRYTLSADASNSLNELASLNETGRAFIYAKVTDSLGNVIATYYSDPVRVTENSAVGDYSNYPVTFDIPDPQARVQIGFKSVGYQTARWFVVDNFTLEYYGKNSVRTLSPTEAILPAETKVQMDFNLYDGWTWVSLNNDGAANTSSSSLITTLNATYIANQYSEMYADSEYGIVGEEFKLEAEYGMKVKSDDYSYRLLRGMPYNLDEHPITLYAGWTWISYLPQNAQTVESALRLNKLPEGSMIKGQNGFAVVENGKWVYADGLMLMPGEAYKVFNAGANSIEIRYAEAETPAAKGRSHIAKQPLIQNWTYNQYKYANIMSVIAATPDNDRYRVAAFVGDECRGVSDVVSGKQFLNVVGAGSNDRVSFQILDIYTGEIFSANEAVDFNSTSYGTIKSPLCLSIGEHIGDATGIDAVESTDGEGDIYTLQGVKIAEPTAKGTYIINGKKVIIK